MENFNILLALATVAVLTIITKIILFQTRQRHRNLPPGPKPWPIIGNMHLIGPSPHKSLHSLSQKYDEIMQLKFGKIPVIIASSSEMAKQFLKVHDANFASRPAFAAGKYTAYDNSDVLWAPHGPHWRQARRIYLTEVFSVKRLEFFEPIRVEERKNFLSHLHSLSGKPVELKDHLSDYTVSTIGRMVLGNKYFTKNSAFKLEELQQMLDEWAMLSGVIYIGDLIPWLNFLYLQGCVKRMKEVHKKLDKFHNYVIDDHQATRAAQKDFVAKDVIDSLLQLTEDPDLQVKLTRDCIKGLILVRSACRWHRHVSWSSRVGYNAVIRNPRVIEKAKEELDGVIGRKRWVEEEDLSQLPYIDAIIMETLRLHPLSALLAPHYAIDDCKVEGYNVSKGTVVFINTFSIGRDPNLWDSPEEFLPERFMGKDTDMTGSDFTLLPFGSGRRRCPGYKLGLKIVRTTLANLLHGFNLKLVEGMRPQDICMDEVYRITMHPKHPLSIIMEPTLPPHLYS
ncbi:hypothetical protein C2S52_012723 [Perilla frutescens var. hirtella]|nr:hypothetical protein C2S52_012723 [Perilla frutescens var. hirtella]